MPLLKLNQILPERARNGWACIQRINMRSKINYSVAAIAGATLSSAAGLFPSLRLLPHLNPSANLSAMIGALVVIWSPPLDTTAITSFIDLTIIYGVLKFGMLCLLHSVSQND